MPDWIIRLYVDDTISSSGNIGNPPETEAAIQNLKAYANGEVYTINFDKIHKKIGKMEIKYTKCCSMGIRPQERILYKT